MKPVNAKSRIIKRLIPLLLVPVVLGSNFAAINVFADDQTAAQGEGAATEQNVQPDQEQISQTETIEEDVEETNEATDETSAEASDEASLESSDESSEAVEESSDEASFDISDDEELLEQEEEELAAAQDETPFIFVQLVVDGDDEGKSGFYMNYTDGNHSYKLGDDYSEVEVDDEYTAAFTYGINTGYKVELQVSDDAELTAEDGAATIKLSSEEYLENEYTITARVSCTDEKDPQIGDVTLPTATYVKLDGVNEYISSTSASLAISVSVSDEGDGESGVKKVTLKTSLGDFDMSAEGSVYSFAPGNYGSYEVTGLVAEDYAGHKVEKSFEDLGKASFILCYFDPKEVGNINASLNISDTDWYSKNKSGKIVLTVSGLTTRRISDITVYDPEEETVPASSDLAIKRVRSNFYNVQTFELPADREGKTVYTIKGHFVGDENTEFSKEVTTMIDNTAPKGEVKITPLRDDIVSTFARIFAGKNLVRYKIEVAGDCDENEGLEVSGLDYVQFRTAGRGEPTTLFAKNNKNSDGFYEWTERIEAGKDQELIVTFDGIRLVDMAGNQQTEVEVIADFDKIYLDWGAPRISYSEKNRVNEFENVAYYDKAIEEQVKIEDLSLGENKPEFKEIIHHEEDGIEADADHCKTDEKLFAIFDTRFYDFSAKKDGEYQLNTKIKDTSGNEGQADSRVMRVDTKDPVIGIALSGGEALDDADAEPVYTPDAQDVVVTVKELWIDKSRCSVSVTGTTDLGEAVSFSTKEWSGELGEEDHVATISGLSDGEYTVTVEAYDLALHSAFSASRKFFIDTKNPEVVLSFDTYDGQNGKYYNVSRKATITITEFNFDEKLVDEDLSHEYGHPSESDWSNPAPMVHVKTIDFKEDGIYSLQISCRDKVKRKSNTEKEGEFIIDRTAPEFSVGYNAVSPKNGNYYKDTRIASITVKDLSFDENKLEVGTQAIEEAAALPGISGFSGSGMDHVGTMTFADDGNYGYTLKCTDLAGNSSSEYVSDVFIIDKTVPEVKFSGVENFSANNGAVAPVVSYVDKHMDIDASSVTMTGANNGAVSVSSQTAPTENGFVVSYGDFAHDKSMDDLYTLEARVYDLAGNEAKEELVFSVNRFGSVFVLGSDARALNEQYYTNEPKEVSITEINVDDLTRKDVSISHDGNITELKSGKDYRVTKQGSDTSWKTYTYTLGKENFNRDGIYSVTVYTQDRATNVQDNKSRDAEVNFAVDITAPSIVAADLKDGAVFKEASHVFNVNTTDNMGVVGLTVYKDGDVIKEVNEAALAADGGIESFTLSESDQPQTITMVAEDVAGNKETVVYNNILVSTKDKEVVIANDDAMALEEKPEVLGAVRERNFTILYIIIGLAVVVLAAGAGLILYKNKSSR
ncbi:MAG: hypothetical protein K6G10_09530 [Butyrivibrio sp.]|nr:hypothetical protein [Butyrivibrio sp.]